MSAQQGVQALLAGDLDAADAHLDAAERTATSTQQAAGFVLARAQLALLRGRPAMAQALADKIELMPGALDSPHVQTQRAVLRARMHPGQAALQQHAASLVNQLALPEGQARDVAHAGWYVQLARAAFQQGDVTRGLLELQSWLDTQPEPAERCLAQLVASEGLERNGYLGPAIQASERARAAATQGREAELYSVAAATLCRQLEQAGDRSGQVAAALRAWRSLDTLLGPGGGQTFRDLLGHWRQQWGTDAFDALVNELA